MKAQILLIDDDERLGQVLTTYLQKFDFQLTHASHPDKGLEYLKGHHSDLVILDIMMPDTDGMEVCRQIRKFSQIPIIFLSARGDTSDRIVGLELGADDFLPKPFEPRELVARIESVLRRNHTEEPKAQAPDSLVLDNLKMEAYLNNERVELTSSEFLALSYLKNNSDKTINRDELQTHVQGLDSEAFGRSIDILISRIRSKLGDNSKNSLFIKTVRGNGYRYIGGHKHE